MNVRPSSLVAFDLRCAPAGRLAFASALAVLVVLALGATPSAAAFPAEFGSEGEGAGQFYVPEAIAVDNCKNGLGEPCTTVEDPSSGDVYIADRNQNRIDKFGPSGEFLLAWGYGVADGLAKLETCGPDASPATSVCHPGLPEPGLPGGAAGQLDFPNGLAVDTDPLSLSRGDVYVEDYYNDRIDKFGPNGEFLLAWGWGVANGEGKAQTCGPEASPPTATCQPGLEVKNHAAGEFDGLPERAIAVDSSGAVYVGDVSRVQEFSPTGIFERQVTVGEPGKFVYNIAVDTGKHIYAYLPPGVHEYEACATSCVGKEVAGSPFATANYVEAIALGLSGEVFTIEPYTVNGPRVGEYRGGIQVASIPGYSESIGLTFAEAADRLLDLTSSAVHVVSPSPVGPLIEAQEAKPEPKGTARLTATFDPEGQVENPGEEATVHFEYGETEAYGTSTPPEPSVGGNFESRTVNVNVSGLKPTTVYHFRVVVTNAQGKTTYGHDVTFTTLPALSIATESVAQVTSTSARLQADIDPLGSATKYRFEYGHTLAYEEGTVVEASIGAGVGPVPVGVTIENLDPDTTYHYRVVATNPLAEANGGPVFGAGETFTTQSVAPPSGLIDGRAWEMVSPPDKHGVSPAIDREEGGLYQSAVNGDAFTYFAVAPITSDPPGTRSFSDSQFLAQRRAPGEWATQDITTPSEEPVTLAQGSEYRVFSNDLSSGLVGAVGATPLCNHPAVECPEHTPYVRDTASGEYKPVVNPSDVLSGVKYGGVEIATGAGFIEGVRPVSATPDLTHVVLTSYLALTSEFKKGFTGTKEFENLYEWSGGKLQIVSVLPNGFPAAESGLASYLGNYHDLIRNAISADGTQLVFQAEDRASGHSHLYLRDVPLGRTVQLDAVQPGVVNPGTENPSFVDAAPDGGRVFFTDGQRLTANATGGDLYMCEISIVAGEPKCALKDLTVPLHTGEHAGMIGIDLGVNQSGSSIDFVASGVLASDAQAGAENLYVEDTVTGQTRLVAVLSGEDSPDWGYPPVALSTSSITSLTTRVSTNGRYVAFMSDRSLTGYDNEDVSSRVPGERLDEEVFLYHAPAPEDLGSETGTLSCVSCDPTGARPHGVFDPGYAAEPIERGESALLVDGPNIWAGRWVAGLLPGWTGINGHEALHEPRNLDDSGRLFFDSSDSLVPQDTNGVMDVYESEPQGVGGCGSSIGCVGLISSGTSSEESAFMDASGVGPGGGEGEDVFFLTAAKLVPQDVDRSLDVYDTHVCSTAAPCAAPSLTVAPACTTVDSCRAAPAPQPGVFGSPSSATFSGPGNVAPGSTALVVKARAKAVTRSQKLGKALKVCRRERARRKRAACERRARVRYGAAKGAAVHGKRGA